MGNERHLLTQPATTKLLTCAAVVAFLLIVFLACLLVAELILGPSIMDDVQKSAWLQGLGFVAGVVGVPSALGLWFAMLWYWASLDRGPRSLKLKWFLFLVFANCIAALFYWFVVYRRQAVA